MFPAYTAALDMHDLDTSAIYGKKEFPQNDNFSTRVQSLINKNY